jgi:transposase-like protein
MAKSPIGLDELFKGQHFERGIIVLCVRWYLLFKLSFRDLVLMMAEHGVDAMMKVTIPPHFCGSNSR